MIPLFTIDIKYILPIVFIMVAGCSSPTPTDTIPTIDIEKALNNPCDILLSDLADGIEYIPLENLSESVTGRDLRVFSTDEYLVAVAFRINQLFDRKTGKFIREIGRYGQGPNDYLGTRGEYAFDENRQTIRCGGNQLEDLEYDLGGNVIRRINYPDNDYGWIIPLEENSFVKYIQNKSGNEPYKLCLFDDKGNVLNKFSNHHSYIRNPNDGSTTFHCAFYRWKNDLFCYEECVDTLFQITKTGLIPRYRFNLGKYNPPYSQKSNLYKPPEHPKINKYIRFQVINESDRFLFFSFWHDKKDLARGYLVSRYFGFYDKKSGITKVSEVDLTDRSPVINDLDDFAPLYLFYRTVNKSGGLTAYLEAEDIIDWFKENREKARKLPKHL